jgi:MYXO-CTERM domain-containing protein
MHLDWRLLTGTALRNGKVAVAACAIALMSSGMARAAVVFGPGDQQSPAGQEVEWTFSVTDDSDPAVLASGSFTIPNVEEGGPFEPLLVGTTSTVDCTIAERLAGGFTAQSRWLGSPANRVAVTWAAIPSGNPTTITTGELMTCKFVINAEATGDVELGCTNADASDPDGNTIEDLTCQPGMLTIGAAPTETPTVEATQTPTETPGEGGGPFAGCYTGQFPVPDLGNQLATIDLICGDDGSMTGSKITLPSGLGALTCTGTCDPQSGDFSSECTGLATVNLSGTLPEETGNITLESGGETGDVEMTKVPCPGGPTPTATSGGGGATPTPTPTGQVFSELISESGCNVITANSTGRTPWALIIPAAALLVLRRRRR